MPVHLICGFLGAGKTTLLRRILAEQPSEERLVVLVNEFGELGIDGEWLQGFESEVKELASGCICCTLKADFVMSLVAALKDFRPHRVIVEATGLAEAGDLSGAVYETAKRSDVELGSVATVVDADFFNYREMLGPLYFNQIKHADLVLLNKTDLVEPVQVDEFMGELTELNPTARIMPVVHCAVDRATILFPLAGGTGSAGAKGAAPPLDLSLTGKADGHDHDSTEGFVGFAFEDDEVVFDPDKFDEFLAELPWGVFRLKGFVRFPDGLVSLNYTYRRPEFTPTETGGRTRLAFVGWQIDSEQVLLGLKRCIMS